MSGAGMRDDYRSRRPLFNEVSESEWDDAFKECNRMCEGDLEDEWDSVAKSMYPPSSMPPDLDSPKKSKQEGGDHYSKMAFEPIEYILANKLGYCESNVIKYVSRYKSKGGISDLKKAIHYLEILITEQS